MNATLAAESRRVNRDLDRILSQGSLADEVPLRLHSRETDSGGAPEFHEKFVHWIGIVCWCGRGPVCAPGCRATRFDEHTAACEPGCPTENARFRASDHKSRPQRLKKAIRMVRKVDPRAHDLLYLRLVLGFTFHGALEKMNASNVSRGKPEMTEAEFVIASIAAGSMLAAAF